MEEKIISVPVGIEYIERPQTKYLQAALQKKRKQVWRMAIALVVHQLVFAALLLVVAMMRFG